MEYEEIKIPLVEINNKIKLFGYKGVFNWLKIRSKLLGLIYDEKTGIKTRTDNVYYYQKNFEIPSDR